MAKRNKRVDMFYKLNPGGERKFGKNSHGTHLMSVGNGEYTICGDAFDVEKNDPMLDVVSGKVTCRRCLAEIRNIQKYLSDSHPSGEGKKEEGK